MEHRHVFNTSQVFEADNDHGLHHTEGSYVQFGNDSFVASGAENGSLLHSVDNMLIDTPNIPSPWISPPNFNRYSLSSHTVEGSNHQTNPLGPFCDPYLHPSSAGSFCVLPENGHYASSSSYNSGQTYDATIFNHETSHSIIENGNPNASLDIGGYSNDFGASRNPGNYVPQYRQGTISQSVGGNRSRFSHLSIPTFQPSSSNLHAAHSNEALPLVTESNSYIHARQSSNTGWRNSDRNGQGRISNKEIRPLSYEAGIHNRVASQGLTLADRSAYGSGGSFDEYRDMRLDIDDMNYEELLALGERIGSVNTGLSEDMILKYMMELIYCSSDETQEDGRCVICLEEYKNMDDVGMLKACGHDFHVGCIRKWLSLKNMCPICKSSVMPPQSKEK